jgi:Cu(I)/Ag(I) efflux system membrane fusion protein
VQAALLIDSQSQLMQLANQSDADNAPTGSDSMLNSTDVVSHLTETQLPKEFADAVLKITAALSSDDLATYQQELPAVKENVGKLSDEIQNVLKPLSEKLVTGKTLKEVRRPFEVFSNTVADIVRQQPQDKRQAFIFQCPMSPVLGTARWIQPKNETVLNPFFGSEMLNCGIELK